MSAATAVRLRTSRTASCRGGMSFSGLPYGRRASKGTERRYVLCVPQSRKESLRSELKQLVTSRLFKDASAPLKKYWTNRAGARSLKPNGMRWGNAFAVPSHAVGFAQEILNAAIVDGVLRATEGSITSQEERIAKVDRHHRRCTVCVVPGDGIAVQALMNAPLKS